MPRFPKCVSPLTFVVLALLLGISACGGSTSTTPAPAPSSPVPTVTSFSPTSGAVGATITVTGTNLTGATAVTFNGTAAVTFSVASATQLTAVVPTGATTGKISVTTGGGTGSSGANFTVIAAAPQPTITSFNPTSGPAGTSVAITGTGFTGTTSVTLNGTAATFAVNSDTQVTATVPASATSGTWSVTTPGGTATSSGSFTVTIPAPTITGFSPTAGPVGTPVILTGTNLSGATAVSVATSAATFVVNSATQITATIPAAATSGKFSVTTPAGTAMSTGTFTVNTSSTTLDLSIDGLYVTQATQDYPAASVPLVQDRSAWVRVFVKANETNSVAPQVKVDFVNGSTTNTLTINAPSSSVPTAIDPNTDSSWDAAVSSAWIQPGVTITATVDPSNAIAEADETNNQFTATPTVQTLKPWKVTLVPVVTKDGTGSITSGTRTTTTWIDFARRLHPVPDAVDVTTGSALSESAS